jgi:hypothetical protein
MKKVVVAIPHSHTWFWTQTCAASLLRNPPKAVGCEVETVIVDNSPWSPAILGIMDTDLSSVGSIYINHKTNKFHASALDCVVEKFEFDYLMALETDVMVLQPGWLRWFMTWMKSTDFAVGMRHHEHFVNPSCTLYSGQALREMAGWCRTGAPQDELRWGHEFNSTAPLDSNLPLSENPAAVLTDMKAWIGGPFAEKRGWPAGTVLRETPSGQLKGPGWYEPGQQLHHWAVDSGYTYTVCPSRTHERQPGFPVQTVYGWSSGGEMPVQRMVYEGVMAVHFWGGTRALDILKHPVTCEFVKAHTPYWLEREARLWREHVPRDVQERTLELIKEYGWHIRGQGTPDVTDRDREAAAFARECYRAGGVEW